MSGGPSPDNCHVEMLQMPDERVRTWYLVRVLAGLTLLVLFVARHVR